jgi:hypothetical protein
MPARKHTAKPGPDTADTLARLFEDFDFSVESDDFLFYEIAGLIDEDRASFEDEAFRRIIDQGIHDHIEERIELRAAMARRLRAALPTVDGSARTIARRTIEALENSARSLRNASIVVRTYTGYMLRRLDEAADGNGNSEAEARALVERWRNGEILRQQATTRLAEIGRAAVAPLADLLFDVADDDMAAEFALDTLATIRTASSARVLAHAVLEPSLSEQLELKAYQYARSLWPLPRHYMLYTLSSHTHEDLSFRWFQLLVESDELTAVDMILEEVLVHGGDAAYEEDLKSIIELLRLSHDPEVEEKLVAVLNDPQTAAPAARLLQEFAATFHPSAQPADNPWSRAERMAELNRHYLAAARLVDSGRTEEGFRKLDAVLQEQPDYPFAVTLRASASLR